MDPFCRVGLLTWPSCFLFEKASTVLIAYHSVHLSISQFHCLHPLKMAKQNSYLIMAHRVEILPWVFHRMKPSFWLLFFGRTYLSRMVWIDFTFILELKSITIELCCFVEKWNLLVQTVDSFKMASDNCEQLLDSSILLEANDSLAPPDFSFEYKSHLLFDSTRRH